MNSRLEKFRHFENFHIVLWLIKDLCWCTLSRTMGVIMIVPTVGLAVYITWIHRRKKVELFHNSAVVLWICANSIWMIGEFYYTDEHLRHVALIFFIAGLGTAAYYYFSEVIFKKQKIQSGN